MVLMTEQARTVAEELGAAELGDARRSRRLAKMAASVAARPEASFPEIAQSESELEAIYRLLSNEHVSPDAILEPHLRASVARAQAEPDALVLHDTTYFVFEGEREGLGRVHVKDHGFWGHFALAVAPDRRALGVVGWKYGTRHGPSKWKGSRRIKGVAESEPTESLRWSNLISDVRTRFGERRVVHVMDREADWFELLQQLVAEDQRFVIRLAHDRRVESDEAKVVSDLWPRAQTRATRDVHLSARAEGGSAKKRKTHPGRQARVAQLDIRGVTARLRSSSSKELLTLNLVHVVEAAPPEGCAPVVWTLVTTESVESEADLLRVVDAYRARWVIEEFFKALKTGCSFEKRQLGSYAALLNALAVFTPVAWSLLRLRDTGRRLPNASPLLVLDAQLLAILVRIARRPLPEAPNARDVMYAVAGLGGHLRRNGDPGWLTLARGFERLLEAARLAALLGRCDQS